MSDIELAIYLLFGAVIAAIISQRYRRPIELCLLIGSLAISLVPGLPHKSLDTELVFLIFLPPILFSAAYFTSWRDFKYNIRPIALLAIGLVVATTWSVAVTIHYLIPGIGWPLAFLLGATVSPPDASAATALTKQLGIPRRLVTILEGESLLNDATALVCFRFALAAVLGGTFSLQESIVGFFSVSLGGIACGLLVAWLSFKLVLQLEDTKAATLLTIVTSFIAYLVAEKMHVSGVISTVAAGLYAGRTFPVVATAQLREDALAIWGILLLAINAFVFALIGFQLPEVLAAVQHYPIRDLGIYCLALIGIVMLVRFVWIYPATYIPRLLSKKLATRDPAPPWRMPFILSWTGMRGIVSLAAALSIPYALPDGSPLPHRSLIIFLTFVVIVGTLIIPSITLPYLMRLLKIKADGENHREMAIARVRMTERALSYLKEEAESEGTPAHILNLFMSRYERQICRLTPNLSDMAYSELDLDEQQARRLLLRTLELEHTELLAIRREALIHDEVFHELTRELDREELRIKGNTRAVY